MDNKKTIIASIIGVALLVVLVVGASFAYFTTAVTNDDGETLVTGKTDAIGSISLTNPTSNLHITLNAIDMAQDNLNTYWATNDATLNYDEEEVQRDIAVATLTGGEATTYYECTTTINVSVSGTMVAGLQTGDAYIQFGGLLTNKVDLKNVSSTGYPVTFALNGTDKLTDKVSAAIAIENRNANQNSIAGKELSVTFSNDDLDCKVVEAPEVPAFAIYSETDDSLRFYKNNDVVNVGDTYNNLVVTSKYTGFENAEYTLVSQVPWSDIDGNGKSLIVKFEDEIKPVSLAHWFNNFGYASDGYSVNSITIDLTNLNTSEVTNMKFAFALSSESENMEFIGLNNLDVSNVTDMSGMFASAGFSYGASITSLDLSGWDTSSVTNMSYMFQDIQIGTIIGLDTWDVSNVTNMSYMFCNDGLVLTVRGLDNWIVSSVTDMSGMFQRIILDSDISNWDVSSVTNMNNMFETVEIPKDLDLSGWDVKNVSQHNNFSGWVEGSGTFTPPNFPTT